MKRLNLSLCLLFSLMLQMMAQNYPYRSDLLWVTVPDHDDWIYRTGEKATIDLQLLRYGMPVDGVTVHYELANDLMEADRRDSVVLKKGRAKIALGTMKKPGFRDCRLSVTFDGKRYKHHLKVGFSPEAIKPYTQMPKDFQSFWQQQI